MILVLTLVSRWPLWLAALASYLTSIMIWVFVFSFAAPELFPAALKAFLVATELSLILFGAIGFLHFLSTAGRLKGIVEALSEFAGDIRIRALLLAWLFTGFIEGAAGFGTPAAIVAPLLASMGLTPVMAAVLPLIGDSAAVPFGAVGTPVRIGLEGLADGTIAPKVAGINIGAAIVAPLAIVIYANAARHQGQRFALATAFAAAFLFTIPAYIVSYLGPEFPSLLGALFGLSILIIAMQLTSTRSAGSALGLAKQFLPYLVVTVLLLGGKYFLGSARLNVSILGERFSLAMFQPGLAFVTAAILFKAIPGSLQSGDLMGSAKVALGRLPKVWLAILFVAALAQNVAILLRDRDIFDAIFTAVLTTDVLIIASPFVGAFGAFVAGSATVSCLLFGGLLVKASTATGADPLVVLSLLLVGAGAGNMVALQNLVAVQAAVGIEGKERQMLAKLWLPCLAYVGLAAFVGWVVF